MMPSKLKAVVPKSQRMQLAASSPALTLEPALARLETHAHGDWLIGALSHQGTGHAAAGQPNQDAFRVARFGTATALIVADGVSSAASGTLGSNFAVDQMARELDHRIALGKPFDATSMTNAVTATRAAVTDFAKDVGKPLGDFATTLLAAVITPRTLTVAKIGDGAVVAVENYRDDSGLVSLLDSPYIGAGVVDLTHTNWRAHLRVRHLKGTAFDALGTVALASDGAAPYFLKAATPQNTPNARATLSPKYICTELKRQLAARGARNLIGYFAGLMFLPNHIDEPDDKTLVLATRERV